VLILEYKLRITQAQQAAIDEAIRTVQFIRNKCLRLWMDGRGIGDNDLQVYCSALAKNYPFAARLNSQAHQTSADRAWLSIARFYKHCKEKKPGKKGYPRFRHDNRSVENKASGWRLEPDGKRITFTDGTGIGTLRMMGTNPHRKKTRSMATFPLAQIKRVRLVKRADGYYCQVAVQAERTKAHEPTGNQVGIDVGLKAFLYRLAGADGRQSPVSAQSRGQAKTLAPPRLPHPKTLQEPQTSHQRAGQRVSESQQAA
jgi:putative transposase